jgi:LysM repeat protein
MDTLSRDTSSSSGSVLPLAGVILGVIALLLGIFTMVKANKIEKAVTSQGDEIAKIGTIENEVRAATSKSEADMRNLRNSMQTVLDQIGTEIGNLRTQMAKMEEQMKKPAPAPASTKGGASAAPAPTGVRNADGTYTVAAGDNLSKIARKFGTNVDSILAENPGLTPTSLKIGQKIRLPR